MKNRLHNRLALRNPELCATKHDAIERNKLDYWWATWLLANLPAPKTPDALRWSPETRRRRLRKMANDAAARLTALDVKPTEWDLPEH